MSIYARIAANAVAELIDLPVGATPDATFHADVAATLVACQDPSVAVGWAWSPAAGFSAPVVPAPTASDLSAYANAKQVALATGGFTLTIGGQALAFATDIESRTEIMGKYLRMAQPGAPTTIRWQFAAGFMSIASADFVKAALAIADFVQAVYDALDTVLAAITAGTITSFAGIDAAAWPSPIATS